MKTLIQELRAEHEVILNKLDTLERALQNDDFSQVGDFLEFFETYIEERHHAKEEGRLFPRMRENAHLADVVDTLLEEHREERRMVEELRSGKARIELISTYIDNLRWHIAKENSMIFESAEQALTQ